MAPAQGSRQPFPSGGAAFGSGGSEPDRTGGSGREPFLAEAAPGASNLGSLMREHAATWAPQDHPSPQQSKTLRSPREVQVLLSSIESREAALRAKVQQLADEKASQQQQLEEEVRELKRSNAQMESELRMRRGADAEARGHGRGAQDLSFSK